MSGGSNQDGKSEPRGNPPDEPQPHATLRGQLASRHDQNLELSGAPAGSQQPVEEGDVSDLLHALRDLAREEDREIDELPAQQVPELSAAARTRLLSRILNEQSLARGGVAGRQPNVTVEIRGDELAVRRQKPSKRWSTFVFGTAGIAVAAAAVLVVSMRTRSEPTMALPVYAVSATGGVALLRGGSAIGDNASGDGIGGDSDSTTAAPQHIRPESELRIVCRPYSATSEPIAVRAFVVQGTSVDEVHPTVRIAPTGAAELRIAGSDIVAKHHGHAIVRVAIGRTSAVGALDAREASAVSAAPGAANANANASAARWLTVPVDIEAP